MIEYRVVHQLPGRIKIHIPLIKGLSIKALERLAERLQLLIELPQGIKKVRPNPVTGNVVIEYDPAKIDIMSFIDELSTKLSNINLAELKANTNPNHRRN